MIMSAARRILLVEDNSLDAELALAAFRQNCSGDDVVVVRGGEDALDYLLRRGAHAARPAGLPALILLDLKMPKVDGFQVLDRLKNDRELQAVPVVMMTSSRESRDVVRSYELGANAYVVKPVDFNEFVQCIQHLTGFWARVNEPPPGCIPRPPAP